MASAAGYMPLANVTTLYSTAPLISRPFPLGPVIGIGLQIYLAQLLFFESCRFAPASLVGPLEYSSVAWACLFGLLIFADVPTAPVVIGGLLVIVSGVSLAISSRRVTQSIVQPSNVDTGS